MLVPLPSAVAAEPLPVLDRAPASPDAVRLVFVGDTGKVPDGDACTFRADGSVAEACHVSVDQLASLRRAIRSERADAIYALGDLVYWRAPACRTPAGRDHQRLAASIGAVYADLDAPVYLVLGNHDKAQRARAPRRVACLEAFADQVEALELPAEQYVVDHGLVRVVVVDTNRKRTLPTAELRSRLAEPGWLVVAGHHDLRVVFDKEDPYSKTELAVGAWLREVGAEPDLWANGHAHLLQFGVYDAAVVDRGPGGEARPVPALTSGTGSKVRAAPSCGGSTEPGDQAACEAPDPRGMPLFSRSTFGYAVVVVTPDDLTVELVDWRGERLYQWRRPRDEAGGAAPR